MTLSEHCIGLLIALITVCSPYSICRALGLLDRSLAEHYNVRLLSLGLCCLSDVVCHRL